MTILKGLPPRGSREVVSHGAGGRTGQRGGRQAAPGLGGVPPSASLSPPNPPTGGLCGSLRAWRYAAGSRFSPPGFRSLRGRPLLCPPGGGSRRGRWPHPLRLAYPPARPGAPSRAAAALGASAAPLVGAPPIRP